MLGTETQLAAACLFAESPNATGGGTGVFASPAAASAMPAHLPSRSTTEPDTSKQQASTAPARQCSDNCEAAEPAAGRLEDAAVLQPSGAGSGGWVTGKGRAAHVPAATNSRFAALFSELDEVADLAAAAAEPDRSIAALVTPPPAGRCDGTAEPQPPAEGAAFGWSTGAGHAVPASAVSLAHAAALLFGATPSGSSSAAVPLAAKAEATTPATAVPDTAPEVAHIVPQERAATGQQGVGSPWMTAKGNNVHISAAAAAHAAAVLGASTFTATDAGQTSKPPAERTGVPWATARGDAMQVSAEAIAQAAATMGSIGSVMNVPPEGAAVPAVTRQPLAAAAAVTHDTGQDAVCSPGRRKRSRRGRRSQHEELKISAANGQTSSADKGQQPVFGFPILDMMPTPPRRSAPAEPSLHRAAVERSARGVSAAAADTSGRKGRRTFRSPLQTLSAAQQVWSALHCVA